MRSNSRCSWRRRLSVEAAPVLRQVLLGCAAAQLNAVRWADLKRVVQHQVPE